MKTAVPAEWLIQQWILGKRAETGHCKGEREIAFKDASLIPYEDTSVGQQEAYFSGL